MSSLTRFKRAVTPSFVVIIEDGSLTDRHKVDRECTITLFYRILIKEKSHKITSSKASEANITVEVERLITFVMLVLRRFVPENCTPIYLFKVRLIRRYGILITKFLCVYKVLTVRFVYRFV